jgi:hypothetical protein
MNVFVLCTGRCGGTTLYRACRHITNFTAGNETRIREVGHRNRVDYPPNHIEVDNRLSWFLGALDETYGDNARYVHFAWNREATSRLFERRYYPRPEKKLRIKLIHAFAHSIVYAGEAFDPATEVAQHYWDTVTANIRLFLKDKTHVMEFGLESAREDFPKFWDWIGAEGDMQAALAEFYDPENPPEPRKRKGLKGLLRRP